jgi:hypothetical protein
MKQHLDLFILKPPSFFLVYTNFIGKYDRVERFNHQRGGAKLDDIKRSGKLLEKLNRGIQYSGNNDNWDIKYEMAGKRKSNKQYYLSHKMILQYKGVTPLEKLEYKITGGVFTLSSEVICNEGRTSFQFSSNIQIRPPEQQSELANEVRIFWNDRYHESIELKEVIL